MADVKITETHFTLPDGAELYQKTWTPTNPVAKLIHFHGFSEHINRYNDFFPLIASRGITCTGIDGRGWGRSVLKPADKGDAGTTDTVLSDMAAFISSEMEGSQLPVFVLGHSMGGGQVLTLASTPKYHPLVAKLSGLMLESPWVALPPRQQPNGIVVFVGRLAGKLMPKYQHINEIPLETITRDTVVQQSLANDPLCHNTGTLETFANTLDRAAQLNDGTLTLSPGVVKALWLSHGSGDQVTDHDASKRWYERESGKIADAEFKSYDGWSHQLHCDLPETVAVYAKDVGDWILARCAPKPLQAKL